MNRSHARRPTALQKRDLEKCAEALNLRLGGMSYRAIADTQTCDVSTAHDRVQRALRSIVPTEKVEELRQIENERLNAAVTACLNVLAGTQTITIDEREVELPYSRMSGSLPSGVSRSSPSGSRSSTASTSPSSRRSKRR
jgi:hypothetical protein